MENLLENDLDINITDDISTQIPRDGFVFTYVELPKTLVDKISSREDLSIVIIDSMLNSVTDIHSLLNLTEEQIKEDYLGKTLKTGMEAIGIAKTIDKVYAFNDQENNTRLFMTVINNSKFNKIEKELLRAIAKSKNGLDILFNSLPL